MLEKSIARGFTCLLYTSPQVLTVQPEDCAAFVRAHSDHGGADVVLAAYDSIPSLGEAVSYTHLCADL